MAKCFTLFGWFACATLVGLPGTYGQSPENAQQKHAHYARLELKGRLEKQIVPPHDPVGTIVWTVTAGERTYALSFANSPFVALAERCVGKTVLVSGELKQPRQAGTPLLVVKAFSSAEIDTKVENADLVKGLTLRAELKQVIETFSSHGRPQIGDSFELDFDHLPQEMIKLTPHRQGDSSYIPFSTPLVIERIHQATQDAEPRLTVIDLSTSDTEGRFRIRVIAEGLTKGSKVRIVLAKDSNGRFLGSMATAEGMLQ